LQTLMDFNICELQSLLSELSPVDPIMKPATDFRMMTLNSSVNFEQDYSRFAKANEELSKIQK